MLLSTYIHTCVVHVFLCAHRVACVLPSFFLHGQGAMPIKTASLSSLFPSKGERHSTYRCTSELLRVSPLVGGLPLLCLSGMYTRRCHPQAIALLRFSFSVRTFFFRHTNVNKL